MAERNPDSEELVQSEASNLDYFEEKKDSVDNLMGPLDAQENARGEGENGVGTELNSNNLAVRLAKAKKNRNRNRKRRNKNRSENGIGSNNDSNETLVDTDTEETKTEVTSDRDSSTNVVKENNFEFKIEIVVGNSSTGLTECTPQDEDSIHPVLENQNYVAEQIDSDTYVNSSSVTDTEDSKLMADITPVVTTNIVQEKTSERVLGVTADSNEAFNEDVALPQDEQSGHSIWKDRSPNNSELDTISESIESFINTSSVNVIYQSEGVTITEMENVESEDTICSKIIEENIEALNKLNREWDSVIAREDCLNTDILSQYAQPGYNPFEEDQVLDPEIIGRRSESDMVAIASSTSFHLKVPNPSIERLENEELNTDGILSRSASGRQSLFRNESEQISTVAPFTTDVNEILQQACINLEQGMKSDPDKWGSQSATIVEPLTESQAELYDLSPGDMISKDLRLTELAAKIESNVDDVLKDEDEFKECETFDDVSDGFNYFSEIGIRRNTTFVESEDFNIDIKRIHVSSVDVSSDEDFLQKVIKGNSSDALVEKVSQESEVKSTLPNSVNDLTKDTRNDLYISTLTKSSVNILYQSEDITLQFQETETVQSEAAVHVNERSPGPEVVGALIGESYAFATEGDRLNNNYWPQDTKSEINLLTQNLNAVAVNKSVSTNTEEILPRANSKVETGKITKSNPNVWAANSTVIMEARAQADADAGNPEEDREGKKWSWKSLLPCMSKNPRSKSKDRIQEGNADEEGNRKKRGASLPRFLDRKKSGKSKVQASEEREIEIIPLNY